MISELWRLVVADDKVDTPPLRRLRQGVVPNHGTHARLMAGLRLLHPIELLNLVEVLDPVEEIWTSPSYPLSWCAIYALSRDLRHLQWCYGYDDSLTVGAQLGFVVTHRFITSLPVPVFLQCPQQNLLDLQLMVKQLQTRRSLVLPC